jgi:flagellar basal-body rod protein FlgG
MSILAASMHDDVAQLGVIAQNVAGTNVVAYRQQIGVMQDDFPRAMAASMSAAQTPEALAAQLPTLHVVTDSRPGTLKSTGEPLDAAVQGDGYFVVNTPQGDVLTRRGDFHLDASGTLCAYSGDPLGGTQGAIRVKEGTPQIKPDGTVVVAGQVVGQLEIARPAPGATLQPAGEGFYVASGGRVAAQAQVRQGFLEASNVSPVNQMVALLQATRHFEAGQRFVRAYDEMLQHAIDDLGKV